MSYGEHIYEAMRKNIIESLMKVWEPDWRAFAKPAYIGFIQDISDDLRIHCPSIRPEKGNDNLPKDAEVLLQAYTADDQDLPGLGEKQKLSDVLVDMAENQGIEDAEMLIANSIAAFREKLKSSPYFRAI
jgi:hypothetical protein